METPSFIEKKEQNSRLSEILQELKEAGKELISWKRTDLDTIILHTYCRRFAIVVLAMYGASIPIQFGKQAFDRIQYEHSKKKFQEKYQGSSTESVQELHQRAIEAYGEEYIKSLPGIGFVTGKVEKKVLKAVEEDKPEIFTLEGNFKLGDWDTKFIQYEKQYGQVLEEVVLDKEKSSDYLIFKKDTVLDTFPGETFEQWAERMDKASLDTVSTENFMSKMETFFPKGWIKGEIGSFHYDEKHPELTDYGSKGSVLLGEVGENKALSLFGIDRELSVAQTFAHELGHENDWERSTKLSPEQRLELLMKVHDRVISDNRFRSDYVESVLNGSLYPEMKDEKTTLQTATTEYWAEILEEYFSNGVNNLPVEDVEVIEWMIRIVDPEFLITHSVGGVFATSYVERTLQQEKLSNQAVGKEKIDTTDEKEYEKIKNYRKYLSRKGEGL